MSDENKEKDEKLDAAEAKAHAENENFKKAVDELDAAGETDEEE